MGIDRPASARIRSPWSCRAARTSPRAALPRATMKFEQVAYATVDIGCSVEEEAHHRLRRVGSARIGVGATRASAGPGMLTPLDHPALDAHACHRPAPRRGANTPGSHPTDRARSGRSSRLKPWPAMIRPAFEGWTVVSALRGTRSSSARLPAPPPPFLDGACSIPTCPRIAVKADMTSLAEP